MKKPTKKQILSGDYTDIGFERGVDQAKAGDPKSVKLSDFNPVNFGWRWDDAIETYSSGQASGFDAQLKKNAGIYAGPSGSNTDHGSSGVSQLSFEEQLMLIGLLVENLSDLEGFLGTIRDGYGQNINASESMGLGTEYISGLREREARLNATMDEVQNIIRRHRSILDNKHRSVVLRLLQSANEGN